jgi:hypothetical protein
MNDDILEGDEFGILLIKAMWQSQDPEENAYAVRLHETGQKFGSFWFTDLITQREKKLNNQIIYKATWNHPRNKWLITSWYTPEDASVSARILAMKKPLISSFQSNEWSEVTIDSIIVDL